MFDKIVLNIPHSSPVFPFGKHYWEDGIDTEILRWTDWYTDWLFQSTDPRIISVSYPFSRFFCDVERLEHDPLESIGQGVIYRSFNGLRRFVSSEVESWAKQSYHEHLDRLCSHINGSHTLVMDCHSFPADLSDIEVCIGLNDDWSRPHRDLIDIVQDTFSKAGYTVGINCPYSNSITPSSPYPYQSMMIELNKSIYMDGADAMDIPQAIIVKRTIHDLYDKILH